MILQTLFSKEMPALRGKRKGLDDNQNVFGSWASQDNATWTTSSQDPLLLDGSQITPKHSFVAVGASSLLLLQPCSALESHSPTLNPYSNTNNSNLGESFPLSEPYFLLSPMTPFSPSQMLDLIKCFWRIAST